MTKPYKTKTELKLLKKPSLVFFMCICLSIHSNSQTIYQTFYKDSTQQYFEQKPDYTRKNIPKAFDTVIQIALMYYPELKGTKIKFKVKKKVAPLSARPNFWAVFRKPINRKYVVIISNKTKEVLTPILLKNLGYNSQIGVVGHELAHLAEFNSKNGLFFIGLLFKQLSKKSMDTFEYKTDLRCINYGLGFQLLSWSEEVRKKFKLKTWSGANDPMGIRERYMNPSTIKKYIDLNPIYKKMKK